MDLEIALQRVVRMDTTTTTLNRKPNNNNNNNASDEEEQVSSSRECLSQDCWVNFRVGHAGDASALASCYQKSKQQPNESISDDKTTTTTTKEPSNSSSSTAEEDTSLEVRLADGLGDEDTPPVIFALIADVSFRSDSEKRAASEKKSIVLGAAALLSIVWEEDSSRVLNVEWLHVCNDHDTLNAEVASLLERRMWLRLSALALMTSCALLVAPINTHNTKKTATEAVRSDSKTTTVSKTAADQQRCDTSSDRL